MRADPLAVAMFAWILRSEPARGEYRKIANAGNSKNRSSVNGSDCGLSGDAGNFCQCAAFSA